MHRIGLEEAPLLLLVDEGPAALPARLGVTTTPLLVERATEVVTAEELTAIVGVGN
jgi:hypothetical protein